nr:transposase [Acetivibrio clariflavus]
MSTKGYQSETIEELYGFSLSAEMVSKITDRIASRGLKEWQQRPLEPIYSLLFLWMQYHYKVKDGRRNKLINRAGYVVLGVY